MNRTYSIILSIDKIYHELSQWILPFDRSVIKYHIILKNFVEASLIINGIYVLKATFNEHLSLKSAVVFHVVQCTRVISISVYYEMYTIFIPLVIPIIKLW